MLRFLSTDVELPNPVQHALEDGTLVLFCGAGISTYTGLPDFRELTKYLFSECGVGLGEPRRREKSCDTFMTTSGSPEEAAFWDGKYDRALALLEKRVPPGVMRKKLVERLTQSPSGEGADCALHRDLLDLAALRGGGHRLVTTNFDDRFHLAADSRIDLEDIWEAPRIAVPRRENWRSLTFLHGRITESGDRGIDNLVLTRSKHGVKSCFVPFSI